MIDQPPMSGSSIDIAYDEQNRLVVRRAVLNPVGHWPNPHELEAVELPSFSHNMLPHYPVQAFVWGPWEVVRHLCEHEFVVETNNPCGMYKHPTMTTVGKCRKCGKEAT